MRDQKQKWAGKKVTMIVNSNVFLLVATIIRIHFYK
jgi:hypothetical protein